MKVKKFEMKCQKMNLNHSPLNISKPLPRRLLDHFRSPVSSEIDVLLWFGRMDSTNAAT